MKKLLIIASAIVALFTVAPTTAEAGYRSKVIGTCSSCGGKIYSYYKPVRYSDGCVRWAWVPSYHNTCRSRHRQSSYRRGYTGYSDHYGYRNQRYRSGPRIRVSVGGFTFSY